MHIIEAVEYLLLPLTSVEVLQLENGAIVAIQSAEDGRAVQVTSMEGKTSMGPYSVCAASECVKHLLGPLTTPTRTQLKHNSVIGNTAAVLSRAVKLS